MQIAMATFTLKPGITEDDLVAASDAFDNDFAHSQEGMTRRCLVRDMKGGYADVVFFESADAMAQVFRAEQDDPAFARLMGIMDPGEVTELQVLKTYG